LLRGLAESGFTVSLARNGRDGLHLAGTEAPDLIVLDVMLPIMDGWQVLRALRLQEGGADVPVIFLTARDEVQDRVKGLELGADDYLVKPFAFAELVARIRNLLRRGPPREDDVIRIGDMEIDVMKRKVSRQGQRITLTAKEFGLLHLLARRRARCCRVPSSLRKCGTSILRATPTSSTRPSAACAASSTIRSNPS